MSLKVSVTVFTLALLSFTANCNSRQRGRAATPLVAQGEPGSVTAEQKASHDWEVKEEVLGLRRFLYADGSLKELADLRFDSNEVVDEQGRTRRLKSDGFEINKVFDEARSLVEGGKPREALDFLQSVNTKHDLKRDPAYWLTSAYAKQQLGDLQGARQSLREVLRFPEMETRIVLNVWKVLRELGDKPEAKSANQVLGVIAEIGHEKTVVIVAGYADGESRVFLGSGAGVIGKKESFPEDTRTAAKELVAAAQPFVNNLPPEDTRDLPKRGQVRFVLLTGGGIYAVKDEVALVNKQGSKLHPLWMSSNALLTPLLKFMVRNEQE